MNAIGVIINVPTPASRNDASRARTTSRGPHSDTSWVNMIGVPAVVVPGGFYATGLPFGLEISARLWQDGDLLAYAYAYEQATKNRRPPVLVDRGPLRTTATK